MIRRALGVAAVVVGLEAVRQMMFGPSRVELGPIVLAPNKSGGHVLVALILALLSGVFSRRVNVFIALFAFFLANTRYMSATDTTPNQYVPFALVQHGTLALDAYPEAATAFDRQQPCVKRYGDHLLSCAAVFVSVLATPIFAPGAIFGDVSDFNHRNALEKISAAALTALAVWLMWCVFTRILEDERRALYATFLYASGTAVLTIASQALWQHTGALFGFSIAMYGLFCKPSAFWVGVGCGIAVCSRQVALFAVPGVLLMLPRRSIKLACLAALPFAAFLFAYNQHYFGSPFVTGYGADIGGHFAVDLRGLAGVFVSPARGLLLYSPILLLAGFGLWKKKPLLLSVAVYVLVMASWSFWGGPYSAGPRLYADVLPFFGVGLALAWPKFESRLWRVAAVYSVAMHVMLAFVPPTAAAKAIHMNVEEGPWTWRSFAPLSFLHIVQSTSYAPTE